MTATVRNVLAHDVEEYLVVRTDQIELRVTVEHPFYVGDGTFKTLEALHVGDAIYAVVARASRPFAVEAEENDTGETPALLPQRITSIERIRERTRVYNLQTDEPNTFFANGIAVHNKGGGCFPAGTAIRTPQGAVPIDALARGDVVLAVTSGGFLAHATVEEIYATRSRVLVLETEAGTLRTTGEHPLEGIDGVFRRADKLADGAGIVAWRGSKLIVARILRRSLGAGEQTVFNLRVSAPHTFIADGFVVHNKGGGGGGFHGGGGYHGSGGGGGSGDPTAFFIIVGIVVIIIVAKAAQAKREAGEDLDFCYSRGAIEPKASKTRKLLEFIARVDPEFTAETLEQTATSVFVKLQECWQAREYGPMQPLLMPDLYAQHCAQLEGLRRNHEINAIDDLKVERVDIVNVRYTHKENDREFTALITASARDYYVDDRSMEFQRGDEAAATFQEFWTFQRQDGQWLLREIEQSRESDKLKEENFFEQFTDKGVEQVYGKTAGQEGPAGPWLEKSVETKATKIERLLNFLVQTGKLWDRQAMLERAREVFTRVMLAREAGDVTAVHDDELFPVVALDLRQQIGKKRAEGLSIEYRNLCVRKAELILVRNFADNSKDEYSVRISAHAQKIIKRGGTVVSQDEYVTPFVEYWTFGRLDNQWKLKEVLPPSQGEQALREENVDQDSSAAQLQWYYQHKRAN